MTNIKKKISALMVAVMLMSAFSFVLADNVNAKTVKYKPVITNTKVYVMAYAYGHDVKVAWKLKLKYAKYKVYIQAYGYDSTKGKKIYKTFPGRKVSAGSSIFYWYKGNPEKVRIRFVSGKNVTYYSKWAKLKY